MTTRRATTRAMYAHVALASDLPMPREVNFTASGTVFLRFDLLSSASAWCKFLGGEERVIDEFEGKRWFNHAYSMVWHGWRVNLSASEPVKTVRVVPALPANLGDDLSSLVSSDQAAA